MGDWKSTFDAVFFVSIATLICGVIGLIIKICLKMKCETVSLCCGLIQVQRRVDLEVEEEITALELQGGSTPQPEEEFPQSSGQNQSLSPKGLRPKTGSASKNTHLESLTLSPPPARKRTAFRPRKSLGSTVLKISHPEEEESPDKQGNPPTHSESDPNSV